jgi:hypothetical protein
MGLTRLIPEVEDFIRGHRAEGMDSLAIANKIGGTVPTAIRYDALLGIPSRLENDESLAGARPVRCRLIPVAKPGQGTDPSQP